MRGLKTNYNSLIRYVLVANVIIACVNLLWSGAASHRSLQGSGAQTPDRSGTTTEATPTLFRESSFTSATLAVTVNQFVAMGENRTVKELNALIPDPLPDLDQYFGVGERIGWVCRVLFEPKGRKPLHEPGFGGIDLPWNSMS
jgi:hypothetical protein